MSGRPRAAHVFLQAHGSGERSGSLGAEAGSYLSIFAEIWSWCDPDFSEHMHATMPMLALQLLERTPTQKNYQHVRRAGCFTQAGFDLCSRTDSG